MATKEAFKTVEYVSPDKDGLTGTITHILKDDGNPSSKYYHLSHIPFPELNEIMEKGASHYNLEYLMFEEGRAAVYKTREDAKTIKGSHQEREAYLERIQNNGYWALPLIQEFEKYLMEMDEDINSQHFYGRYTSGDASWSFHAGRDLMHFGKSNAYQIKFEFISFISGDLLEP